MHPGWRRCSSLTYTRYARSSRLAGRRLDAQDGTLISARILSGQPVARVPRPGRRIGNCRAQPQREHASCVCADAQRAMSKRLRDPAFGAQVRPSASSCVSALHNTGGERMAAARAAQPAPTIPALQDVPAASDLAFRRMHATNEKFNQEGWRVGVLGTKSTRRASGMKSCPSAV